MRRGAVRKKGSTLVTVWFPTHVAEAVQEAIVRTDSDRSKYIRSAVREKLLREKEPAR
jgi:metal-responsive CopG/Arc/MetJ family transcriptional regulator